MHQRPCKWSGWTPWNWRTSGPARLLYGGLTRMSKGIYTSRFTSNTFLHTGLRDESLDRVTEWFFARVQERLICDTRLDTRQGWHSFEHHTPPAGAISTVRNNSQIKFLSRRFHVLFHSLFRVLFTFPSQYLCAIGVLSIFSLRWRLPPILDLQSQTSRLSDHDSAQWNRVRDTSRGFHSLRRVNRSWPLKYRDGYASSWYIQLQFAKP